LGLNGTASKRSYGDDYGAKYRYPSKPELSPFKSLDLGERNLLDRVAALSQDEDIVERLRPGTKMHLTITRDDAEGALATWSE
jgi:hypothetical protein